jgi:hypothetical protein
MIHRGGDALQPYVHQDEGVGPNTLGTCFRAKLFWLRCSTRGAPWIARGSRIRERSSFVGVLVTMAWYSPGNWPLGNGTEAVRQMCSDVSPR